jgi:carboxypeptidase family protein
LCVAMPLLAQSAQLTGRVTTGDQAPVAAAVVSVTNPDSGWKRAVLSNDRGYFSLQQLPPGEYRVEAVKPGFKPLVETAVDLRARDSLVLELRLTVDPAPQTVVLDAFCRVNEAKSGGQDFVNCSPALLAVAGFRAFWP